MKTTTTIKWSAQRLKMGTSMHLNHPLATACKMELGNTCITRLYLYVFDKSERKTTERMRAIHLALILLVTLSLRSADGQSESYSQYQQCIQSIDRQVVDLTATSDLWGVTNFVILFSNPKLNLTNAIQFLGDVTNNDECKMIVVFSLQNLPLDDYVCFDYKLLYLARTGSLSKLALNEAILPPLNWNIKLAINFENSKVRKLLQECIQSDQITPENKAYCKDLLSGKAKQDVIELEDAGVLPKISNPKP